jgi:hypothetical protein
VNQFESFGVNQLESFRVNQLESGAANQFYSRVDAYMGMSSELLERFVSVIGKRNSMITSCCRAWDATSSTDIGCYFLSMRHGHPL